MKRRNKRNLQWIRASVVVLSLAFLGGCAELEPIFPPVDPPIIWPRSDEPPRYEWVGSIHGESDLRAPRSFWSLFVDFWAGAAESAVMERPMGVAVNDDGVLFVSDASLGVVHRFGLETREYAVLRDAGGGSSFSSPIGVTTAGGSVLVADRALGTISVLRSDGTPDRTVGAGQLGAPVDVAVGPLSGRIYVVDIDTHEIKAFDESGQLVLTFGGRGVGPGEFNFPTHIACDAQEKIYVTDSMNCRIQVFDRSGQPQGGWGKRGVTPGFFSRPKGVACDLAGRVYVVDSNFENVQVFTSRGELLIALGEEGGGPGEFWLPTSICVDGSDRIWVADSFNQRVQVFRYVGQPENSTTDEGAVRIP